MSDFPEVLSPHLSPGTVLKSMEDHFSFHEAQGMSPPAVYSSPQAPQLSTQPLPETLWEQDISELLSLIKNPPTQSRDLDGGNDFSAGSVGFPTPESTVGLSETDSQFQLYYSPPYAQGPSNNGNPPEEQRPLAGPSNMEQQFLRGPYPTQGPDISLPAMQSALWQAYSTTKRTALAPSKRKAPPQDRRSLAHAPYRARVEPSPHHNHDRRYAPYIPKTLAGAKVPRPATVQHKPQTFAPRESPLPENIRRVRRGERIHVPVKPCPPKRLSKCQNPSGNIEFWSRVNATGEKIRGTFMADRFQDDTVRSFLSVDDLAFPGKTEKGFSLQFVWPGYPKFSKKISIHTPLGERKLRDVRDWVFTALADFIRKPGDPEAQMDKSWLVGGDEVLNVIHLDDLVLVRLKQVTKGSWVPELDVLY